MLTILPEQEWLAWLASPPDPDWEASRRWVTHELCRHTWTTTFPVGSSDVTVLLYGTIAFGHIPCDDFLAELLLMDRAPTGEVAAVRNVLFHVKSAAYVRHLLSLPARRLYPVLADRVREADTRPVSRFHVLHRHNDTPTVRAYWRWQDETAAILPTPPAAGSGVPIRRPRRTP